MNERSERIEAQAGEPVRYTGANIGYIPGVPMQDMTAEEWNAIDPTLRTWGVVSGMYTLGGPGEAESAAAAVTEVTPPAQAEPEGEAEKPTRGKAPKGGD